MAKKPKAKPPKFKAEFSGNVSHSNKGDGFVFAGTPSGDLLVRNNRAWGNGGDGFRFESTVEQELHAAGLPVGVDRPTLANALTQLAAIDQPETRLERVGSILGGLGGAASSLVGFGANLVTLAAHPRISDFISRLSSE